MVLVGWGLIVAGFGNIFPAKLVLVGYSAYQYPAVNMREVVDLYWRRGVQPGCRIGRLPGSYCNVEVPPSRVIIFHLPDHGLNHRGYVLFGSIVLSYQLSGGLNLNSWSLSEIMPVHFSEERTVANCYRSAGETDIGSQGGNVVTMLLPQQSQSPKECNGDQSPSCERDGVLSERLLKLAQAVGLWAGAISCFLSAFGLFYGIGPLVESSAKYALCLIVTALLLALTTVLAQTAMFYAS